jgi:hypothetical protein
MSPSCSVSSFAARRARAPMSCNFAYSGAEALEKLAAGIEPQLIVILSDI